MLSTDPNERDRAIISHIDFYGWNDWDFLPWKPEELRRLVCAGANINAKDSNGRTLLHRVCTRIRKPHCLDMVKQILELGAELTPDCDGLTPIMLSVTPAANGIFTSLAKMDAAILREILNHGGERHVDQKDNKGVSAFAWACRCNNTRAMKLLLEAGADPMIPHPYPVIGRDMEWRTHIPCWLPEMRVWQTQYFFPRTRYLCYDKGGADVTIEDKMQPLSATRFCVAKHVLFELKPELFVELMRACP